MREQVAHRRATSSEGHGKRAHNEFKASICGLRKKTCVFRAELRVY